MPRMLNISVVIPTRNAMPHIREHIEALSAWIAHVQQVVVVDSESTDGTLECIRKNLTHANVTYLNHPPGLYQSWNAAIHAAGSKYTYIATVNDFMPFSTLARLHEEAEQHQADVVVSAPTIVADPGQAIKEWPIHRFIATCSIDAPYVVEPLELLMLNLIDLPGTLIGSSASNLYRTLVLQQQSFPCDCGHAGDSAWAIVSSLRRRWLVVPNVESTFWHHGGHVRRGGGGPAVRARLCELATEQVAEARGSATLSKPEQECLIALEELLDLWLRGGQSALEHHAYGGGKIPRVLLPRAWKSWVRKRARARKHRNRLECKKRRHSLLNRVRELYSR